MSEEIIKIRGARQHNLKNVDLDIPKNKLVVFTGVSGSGKSSLAFDTIYAEGQRRYVESLSSYARQFLGVMSKPDVDLIEGLSPAISIDQKTTSHNPRSTVGTVTEIYDYLRLFYARVGHPHCPVCGREIASQSLDQISDSVLDLVNHQLKINKTARFLLLSPVVKERKGEFSGILTNLKAKGYQRVRIDGKVYDLDDDIVLIKTNRHSIDAVVDRVSLTISDLKNKVWEESFKLRLSNSIEQGLQLSEGLIILSFINDKGFEMPDKPKELEDHLFSEKFSCPFDNINLPEIEPRTFSFNSPQGACPRCLGLGKILKVEPDLIFAPELSISEGGIIPFSAMFEHDTWFSRLVLAACEQNKINISTPLKNLSDKQKHLILYGTEHREYVVAGTNRFGRKTMIYETFTGIVTELEKRHKNTDSDYVRLGIEKYMRPIVCEVCKGSRLRQEALAVTIEGKSINQVTAMPINDAISWVKEAEERALSLREKEIGKLIIKEIITRLSFLESVGLNYLSLDRSADSLAGGEAQRIRLASQIGSGLTGVLYVLDEPTIGLHPRDNQKLITTLRKLQNLGNTVVIVEHDDEMIKTADMIVDFGPGAGKFGGAITALGTLEQIKKDPNSLTGQYISGKKKITLPKSKNPNPNFKQESIKLIKASGNNLKNIDIEIPLGKLVVVSGVSGSGKSTFVVDTLYHAVASKLNSLHKNHGETHEDVLGTEHIENVSLIDQSPIGRTPRSNPATYTKTFDLIRTVYASTREAKLSGFGPGRFSFNVKGGRCETCEGQGQIKIEMQFMPDIWVTCEVCKGQRYNSQTLEVTYKGKNIAEVLNMTVGDAKEFFKNFSPVASRLETLEEVGLSYMELGQSATTVSGGEAQRIKLAAELTKKFGGKTLYILDEPTTGLHFADLEKLLKVLRMLVDKGNTVLVIEHNLDVIKNADWIIDLGPEGGSGGGYVVAKGTPKDVAKVKESYTGQFLSHIL